MNKKLIEAMKQARDKLIKGDLLCEVVAVSMLDEAIKREESHISERAALVVKQTYSRDELVGQLRWLAENRGYVGVSDAADMLAADARVPMTDMEIYTALASITEEPEPADEIIGDKDWPEIVDMIRRIEAHHGIKP